MGIRPKFGLKCEKFWLFWWPQNNKLVEISAKIGRKTTFVEKIFYQFFLCFLENIHRNFDEHTTNTGWAISVSGLRPTNRNCLVFSSPWYIYTMIHGQICAGGGTRLQIFGHSHKNFVFYRLWVVLKCILLLLPSTFALPKHHSTHQTFFLAHFGFFAPGTASKVPKTMPGQLCFPPEQKSPKIEKISNFFSVAPTCKNEFFTFKPCHYRC